jgi:hypothetical protein
VVISTHSRSGDRKSQRCGRRKPEAARAWEGRGLRTARMHTRAHKTKVNRPTAGLAAHFRKLALYCTDLARGHAPGRRHDSPGARVRQPGPAPSAIDHRGILCRVFDRRVVFFVCDGRGHGVREKMSEDGPFTAKQRVDRSWVRRDRPRLKVSGRRLAAQIQIAIRWTRTGTRRVESRRVCLGGAVTFRDGTATKLRRYQQSEQRGQRHATERTRTAPAADRLRRTMGRSAR